MTVEQIGRRLRTFYKVRSFHIDVYGHVNNAEYLRFAEMARDDFMEYLGLTVPQLLDAGVRLVIAETRVRYLRPAVYGDTLEIWGWISELGRVRSVWEQEMRRAGTEEVLTHIWSRVACLDAGNRIIPIPAALRQVLERVLEPAGNPPA
ncbi:MAG: acyl-CoA thioesterase [Anaerolineae bacterium]|nr:acyl-CoA thioesterase [Anaerolineae bacterium]